METPFGNNFELPQLPDEFRRDMQNGSISDEEFSRSIRGVLGESSDTLRFIFYMEVSQARPCLFERLAVERLRQEDNRNVGFFLDDLKNETVSNDRFMQLCLLLVDPERGEYAANPELLGIFAGLLHTYRPGIKMMAIAVISMKSRPMGNN